MAVRLNVVMVHPPKNSRAAQRLSEQVVGRLIGLAGIDLTLIDPMDQIQPTSTDCLTLTSLSGDVALLAWQPIGEVIRSLDGLGFDGSRARHAHDLEAPVANSSRRVYCYDLRAFDDSHQLCVALQKLLDSRQVRTFSLGLSATQPLPGATKSPAAARQPAPEASASADRPCVEDAAAPSAGSPSKPPLDLDDLVNQLDWFDP